MGNISMQKILQKQKGGVMKLQFSMVAVFLVALGVRLIEANPNVMIVKPNVLTNVHVSKVGLARQVSFEFAGPFTHTCNGDECTVSFHFPRAQLHKLDANAIQKKFSSLPHLKNVRCEHDEQGMRCTLSFKPGCVVIATPKRIGHAQLICEIYKKKAMENIKKATNGPIAHV